MIDKWMLSALIDSTYAVLAENRPLEDTPKLERLEALLCMAEEAMEPVEPVEHALMDDPLSSFPSIWRKST